MFSIKSDDGSVKLVYAAVKARFLVNLPGIDDSRIFAQNVRLGLGNTRVNDDIIATLKDKKEHTDFLTFHNGLTIVAKTIDFNGNELRINDYSVCNGCQSLLAFYDNQKDLSENLEILVRFVKVGDDRRLPETIAYRTNNQNPISLRDLASNDSIQVHLQSEFNRLFGKKVYYSIKKGEQIEVPVLSNELAGRLILSFFVREPWSTHQKYRIFGDLESKIFNYHITASHIRLAYLIFNVIIQNLEKLANQRLANYLLARFVFLYLLEGLISNSVNGKKILEDPSSFLSTDDFENPKESQLLEQIDKLVRWLITELNYSFHEQGDEAYDYKREFKSPKSVAILLDQILKAYEKDKFRDRAPMINLE